MRSPVPLIQWLIFRVLSVTIYRIDETRLRYTIYRPSVWSWRFTVETPSVSPSIAMIRSANWAFVYVAPLLSSEAEEPPTLSWHHMNSINYTIDLLVQPRRYKRISPSFTAGPRVTTIPPSVSPLVLLLLPENENVAGVLILDSGILWWFQNSCLNNLNDTRLISSHLFSLLLPLSFQWSDRSSAVSLPTSAEHRTVVQHIR